MIASTLVFKNCYHLYSIFIHVSIWTKYFCMYVQFQDYHYYYHLCSCNILIIAKKIWGLLQWWWWWWTKNPGCCPSYKWNDNVYVKVSSEMVTIQYNTKYLPTDSVPSSIFELDCFSFVWIHFSPSASPTHLSPSHHPSPSCLLFIAAPLSRFLVTRAASFDSEIITRVCSSTNLYSNQFELGSFPFMYYSTSLIYFNQFIWTSSHTHII